MTGNGRTSTDNAAKVHRLTVQTSVEEIARFLQENLGQRLTAFIAETKDVKQVGRWAKGEHTPRLEAEQRLRAAHQVFQLIQEVEGVHTARAWMIGMNPELDDDSPAEAIAAGRMKDAVIAARLYVEGE
ncbi:XRE family transcriptional regulator [Streptomyces sp. NPDC001663]|uniref:XRE family transcriptional regulator n=1 Tax=Streptomyces sp. NPDC001663 TaxID=3364597 RepID=UPI00368008D7